MSRPKSDRPAYCLHKRTGRGFVTIDGRQRTLPGAYSSAESCTEYDRLVGTWLASGRQLLIKSEDPRGPTVAMIVLAFWKHAQTFYVDAAGKPKSRTVKPPRHPSTNPLRPHPNGQYFVKYSQRFYCFGRDREKARELYGMWFSQAGSTGV